jgi:hypothetical protein
MKTIMLISATALTAYSPATLLAAESLISRYGILAGSSTLLAASVVLGVAVWLVLRLRRSSGDGVWPMLSRSFGIYGALLPGVVLVVFALGWSGMHIEVAAASLLEGSTLIAVWIAALSLLLGLTARWTLGPAGFALGAGGVLFAFVAVLGAGAEFPAAPQGLSLGDLTGPFFSLLGPMLLAPFFAVAAKNVIAPLQPEQPTQVSERWVGAGVGFLFFGLAVLHSLSAAAGLRNLLPLLWAAAAITTVSASLVLSAEVLRETISGIRGKRTTFEVVGKEEARAERPAASVVAVTVSATIVAVLGLLAIFELAVQTTWITVMSVVELALPAVIGALAVGSRGRPSGGLQTEKLRPLMVFSGIGGFLLGLATAPGPAGFGLLTLTSVPTLDAGFSSALLAVVFFRIDLARQAA